LGGPSHAMLWSGRPATSVDLHPFGYTSSMVNAVTDASQVGVGMYQGAEHALLWSGTPDSAVDLHPAGFVKSRGMGVAGDLQVGYGFLDNGYAHALLWQGSAASVIDLNQFLPGYDGSMAASIDDQGRIYGWASLPGYRFHAVVWVPVPEPATVLILLICLGGRCLSPRRRARQ
jgi:hypothetical protein